MTPPLSKPRRYTKFVSGKRLVVKFEIVGKCISRIYMVNKSKHSGTCHSHNRIVLVYPYLGLVLLQAIGLYQIAIQCFTPKLSLSHLMLVSTATRDVT